MIKRLIDSIDWNLNRPIVHAELHAGVYILALLVTMLTA